MFAPLYQRSISLQGQYCYCTPAGFVVPSKIMLLQQLQAQSGKKTKRKVPKSPRKKGAEEDGTKLSSLATDIAMQDLEKERAQTASSSSATSPPSVEVVPEIAPQVDITTAQNTPQVLDKMPEPEEVAAKPVTFADLFKGNRDPDQGMILKQYDVGEGVLHIPDSVIKPVEELWGFCLVGCFTGRFPGLKAVDAIVKSWNVPCRIIPHCKGWVILKFENDADRLDILGRERDKAYGKEFRLKIPSHGFMFDFAEFTTLPVWVQLHNVPLQLWSEEEIGMLASKVGKPLRTDLVTKQQGKGGFCRVLVEVDFSKQPVTNFVVACMGKTFTQTVVFEEDPKYCFHCKTWNHGPFYCKALELKKELEKLKATQNVAMDMPKEQRAPPEKAGAKEWIATGKSNEPIGGLIPSSSNSKEKTKEPIATGKNGEPPTADGNRVGNGADLLKKKRTDDGNMVGKKPEKKKGGAKLENFVATKLPGWKFATNFDVLPGSRMVLLWNPSLFACTVLGVGEQYLHCGVQCFTTRNDFLLSFIYGLYTVPKRRELWNDLSSLAQNISKPWALLGDFNCVLASNERVNCMNQGGCYMTDLQGFKSSNCLEDVPSIGNFFTWHKGNKLAKLDRVLANQFWGDTGLAPTCEFLDFNFLSDHCPILFQCGAPQGNRHRPFRFFNMWLKHEGFHGLVSKVWEAGVAGSKQFSLCSKLKRLKPPLKSLNKHAFGHISKKAMDAKEEYRLVMKQVVLDPNNQNLLDDAEIKRKKANFFLDAEFAFYQQKAKCDYLMNSDRCTSYFHSIVKKNRMKNSVGFLVRGDGSKTTSKVEVASMFVEYFTNLFGTSSSVDPIDLDTLSAGIRVPSSAHSALLAPVTPEEVREAVFDIGNDKAPGPDGFTAAFFKDQWDLVGRDIYEAVVEFFSSGRLLRQINHAMIVLIPKSAHNPTVKDFRPIACLNVLYKIITKILAKRMAPLLPDMIDPAQGAFVPGRSLVDNFLLAQHLIRDYAVKRLLNKRAKEGGFSYHKDCAALGITHLAFADDLMLFSRGDFHSVQVLMDVLDQFSRVSGLTLNPTKSNIFLTGFLSKWRTLKLSYAGRLELIRAVVQGVQSFWLQAFPVQNYVLERITSMCRDYLWGSKLAKVAWVDICKPKTEGGLGLKGAKTWDNALLCKLLWNLAAKKDTLWVKWVHNVYIQGANIWQWQPKRRHSVFFKRIAYVRDLLLQKLADHFPSVEEALSPYCLAGNLIPRKVYDLFRAKANPKPWMAFIWQSYIPPKCSFTMWLALRRRLPTKTNLEFLGLPMDCTFCGHGLEDVDHLFFNCPFSKAVWNNVKNWLGLEGHLSTLARAIRWLKAFRREEGILKKARRQEGLLWLALFSTSGSYGMLPTLSVNLFPFRVRRNESNGAIGFGFGALGPGKCVWARMSQASTHGQGNTHHINDKHVDAHTEGSSFVPQQNVGQQNVPQNEGNHQNVGGQPDPVLPAIMMHFLQHMEQAQMFQPPPPPPPARQVTLKTLKDNGAEEFLGDNIAEPQTAFDWLDQTTRVLKNLRIPEADRPELAVHSFQKEYIPPRFREGKRAELVALKQGDMTLPEFRQRFDHLAQFAGTLVGTIADRIEEFTTKLRPDIQPYLSAVPTTNFTAAYNQIEKAEKGLIAWKKSVAGSEEPTTQHKGVVTSGGKRTPGGGHSMQHSKKTKSRPAQSGASSSKPRPSRHHKCNLCGRNHPGECWFTQGLCLGCGKAGHFEGLPYESRTRVSYRRDADIAVCGPSYTEPAHYRGIKPAKEPESKPKS
ncbi:unnamed protein product [Cuscuta campestris]|uniref:Reverse transcriptase domain-containing protein n=1 Tax=Cuscuta campestris TaxID=132261 RepID=A0A484M713_9ASTE|nr:unnamed protein product [Cuscuta campestris]